MITDKTNMVLGIRVPKGAKIEVKEDLVTISFDTDFTRMDLWKAAFHVFLTFGENLLDFELNDVLDCFRLDITGRNKIKSVKLR